MKSYQPKTPRTAIAFGAVAMTALTLALSVVGPASIESGNQTGATVVASQAATPSQGAPLATNKADS